MEVDHWLPSPCHPGGAADRCFDHGVQGSPLSSGSPRDSHAAALSETYRWWRFESLDDFLFTVASKVSPDEVELIGLCMLISDQTWTPIHLRLRLGSGTDVLAGLHCRLGEVGCGKGGMMRIPDDAKMVRVPRLSRRAIRVHPVAYEVSVEPDSLPDPVEP